MAGPAMAETELSIKDVDALKKTVKGRLSTLNMELATTENVDGTAALKKRKAMRNELLFLEALLDRL
jgi:hypothetical protein